MPFGLAFYIALNQLDLNKIIIAIFILLGTIISGNKYRVYITAAGMIIFSLLNLFIILITGKLVKKNRNGNLNVSCSLDSESNIKYATIGLISSLIPELFLVLKKGLLLYDFTICILSSLLTFVLVFIFRNAVSLLNRNQGTNMFSNEELISLMITCAFILSGFGDLKIFGIGISNLICVLSIMVISYRYGTSVGTAAGVTTGLVLSLISPPELSALNAPVLIGCFGFCGLLSGLLRNLGKAGTVLGFFIGNTLLVFYMNGSTKTLFHLGETILAMCIFITIPRKSIASIPEFNVGINSHNSSANMVGGTISLCAREVIVGKLNKYSLVFREAAKAFRKGSITKEVIHKHDISSMFDRIVDRVCKNCNLRSYCWDRNFCNTYNVVFKIIECLDQKGCIERSDIPKYFTDNCERINDFIQVVNNMYEIFKIDMMWRNKLGENRNLLSLQLEELSNVILSLAIEIETHVQIKKEFENTLLFLLKREGLRVEEAIVIENKYGKYEAIISCKGFNGNKGDNIEINRIVTNVVGRKMIENDRKYSERRLDDLYIMKFIEQENYCITTGAAAVSRHSGFNNGDNSMSGDNYTAANSSNGEYILALSDGMGSGERASTQSKVVINLIEQFLESGFDKDATIRIINSILALKSDDDYFSTIDLCSVNLSNGEIEFIKIGAAPTFIKRKTSVEIVKTMSLPAGLLAEVEIELIQRRLTDGDMVIQISDGVIDAFEKTKITKEKAICRFIGEIKSINPQTVADLILAEAYKNSGGKPLDDMTIVVAKFWKKTV